MSDDRVRLDESMHDEQTARAGRGSEGVMDAPREIPSDVMPDRAGERDEDVMTPAPEPETD